MFAELETSKLSETKADGDPIQRHLLESAGPIFSLLQIEEKVSRLGLFCFVFETPEYSISGKSTAEAGKFPNRDSSQIAGTGNRCISSGSYVTKWWVSVRPRSVISCHSFLLAIDFVGLGSRARKTDWLVNCIGLQKQEPLMIDFHFGRRIDLQVTLRIIR
ncbi:hypothetical protein TWF694_011717 [Orbilia ellipsospora]|uniref:LAGLIDADG endonuclease n=1 Tax=Orbilia ellipsospora TaxID=2528407 RepID=A0AAV9X629_9PEZI